VERHRLFSNVKVGLRLEAKLLSPHFFQISKPPPNPIAPAIDLAARRCHRRVELDLGVAKGGSRIRVVPVEGLNCAAMKVDIRAHPRLS
jgi:hypothetical protein